MKEILMDARGIVLFLVGIYHSSAVGSLVNARIRDMLNMPWISLPMGASTAQYQTLKIFISQQLKTYCSVR
jgi:hypothetical protein